MGQMGGNRAFAAVSAPDPGLGGNATRTLRDQPGRRRQASEKSAEKLSTPAYDGYAAAPARAGDALKAHTAGNCPPYLWPVMEIAYLCRMRGIEVVSTTDWHETPDGLRVSGKG